MKLIQSLLLVVTCVASFAVSAQWQWLDKDGKRVFSDLAPGADVPAKNILKQPGTRPGTPAQQAAAAAQAKESGVSADATTPTPALSADATPKLSKVDKELEAKKKLALEAETAKRKAAEERITKAKVENCARAKQARTGYESGVRIARTNAAGEREVMDDAARAAELKRIQGIVDTDCK
jgi:hypothetical protein